MTFTCDKRVQKKKCGHNKLIVWCNFVYRNSCFLFTYTYFVSKNLSCKIKGRELHLWHFNRCNLCTLYVIILLLWQLNNSPTVPLGPLREVWMGSLLSGICSIHHLALRVTMRFAWSPLHANSVLYLVFMEFAFGWKTL